MATITNGSGKVPAQPRGPVDARARAIVQGVVARGHGHPRPEPQAPAPRFYQAGGAARSSLSVEHNTPRWVVDALLGGTGLECFGTDPCSPLDGGGHVPASVRYTREDDGLVQEWSGVVYANPPYGRGELSRWLRKAALEFLVGRADYVIALIPARTGARWFRRHVIVAGAHVIFLAGRLRFNDGPNAAGFDSCLALFGATPERARSIAAAFRDSHLMLAQAARRAA